MRRQPRDGAGSHGRVRCVTHPGAGLHHEARAGRGLAEPIASALQNQHRDRACSRRKFSGPIRARRRGPGWRRQWEPEADDRTHVTERRDPAGNAGAAGAADQSQRRSWQRVLAHCGERCPQGGVKDRRSIRWAPTLGRGVGLIEAHGGDAGGREQISEQR